MSSSQSTRGEPYLYYYSQKVFLCHMYLLKTMVGKICQYIANLRTLLSIDHVSEYWMLTMHTWTWSGASDKTSDKDARMCSLLLGIGISDINCYITECCRVLHNGADRSQIVCRMYTTVDKVMQNPWLQLTRLPNIRHFSGKMLCMKTECGNISSPCDWQSLLTFRYIRIMELNTR